MTGRVPRSIESSSDGASKAVLGRVGVSLPEVLVSLLVFMLGMSLSVRVLSLAGQSLDEAELGFRALVFLSEIVQQSGSAELRLEPRRAGPGMLVPELDFAGAPAVRYEPPTESAGSESENATGPYSRSHRWAIAPDR